MDQDGGTASIREGRKELMQCLCLLVTVVRKPRSVRFPQTVSNFSKLQGSGAIGHPAHGNKKDPNILSCHSADQGHMRHQTHIYCGYDIILPLGGGRSLHMKLCWTPVFCHIDVGWWFCRGEEAGRGGAVATPRKKVWLRWECITFPKKSTQPPTFFLLFWASFKSNTLDLFLQLWDCWEWDWGTS